MITMVSIFFFLSLLLHFFNLTSEAAPTFLYHDCTNTTPFSPNSTFQPNLNLLLKSLSSNSTRYNRFYNLSVGTGTGPDNVVYGLYLCRGDASDDLCRDCVETAGKDIVQRCPNDTAAIIIYEECMLRYSNQNFFGKVELAPALRLGNRNNVSKQQEFGELLERTARNITKKIANDRSGRRFATEESPFSSNETIYALGQCTQDLSVVDCNKCLQEAFAFYVPGCCGIKLGGRIIFPSCNFRYELYPFYEVTSPVPRFLSPPGQGERKLSSGKITGIVSAIVAFVGLLIAAFCFLRIRERRQRGKAIQEQIDEITTAESLQFDLRTIEAATNKFSHGNMLGEGGFGQVYKGILPSGQEIAVKRLLGRSWQGDIEFKNEVAVVAKLQHRNLVRLLGFCLGGEEKLLVFEFVPNRSLDGFLFDKEKRRELDWPTRYKIIKGIARGIQYLHEDSQPRIIHRDLKASNILLDGEMNPKISDFGMARIIFGVDEHQGNTSRIVGTYGYMSPEYAMHGQFSVKSDVYSFGVSVLEIISGKKTNSFYQVDGSEDLLSYSWKLWSEGAALELLDPTLKDSCSEEEVIRCIQIGLLCVQEDPAKRPTMTTIVLMLNSHTLDLEGPQQPASFFRYKGEFNIPTYQSGSNQSCFTSMPSHGNDISISDLYPR